jgi:hypothetical protein
MINNRFNVVYHLLCVSKIKFIQIKKIENMENNMMKIAERVYKLIKQQELITEDTEFNILYQISDELLSEMGEIEQYENVKKALVNMFIVGRMFPDNKSS